MGIINDILGFFINFTTHMFLICLAFCLQFKFRKNGGWIFGIAGAAYVFGPFVYREISGNKFYSDFYFMIGWYSVSYILLCTVLFFILYFSFKVSAKELLLILCVTYLIQNVIFNGMRVISYFTGLKDIGLNAINVCVIFIICITIFVLGKKSFAKFNVSLVKTAYVLVFSASIIILLTVISQWVGSSKDNASTGACIYAIIASLLLIFILVGIFNNTRLEYENAVINELLKKAERQHKVSSENIEYINVKVHDLKHQIAAIKQLIGSGSVAPALQSKISELEKTAKVYDDTVFTGNNILDSIIMEQKVYCRNNSIQLDYVIDGGALNFVEPVDLYVIFGNAIDNAIESVLKIDDIDKRIITIRAQSSGRFVSIQFENPYEGEIAFYGGMPKTSKSGKSFHGFGIKSIKFLVAKYGGNVTISAENHRFCLSVFIPINNEIKHESDAGAAAERA